MKFYYTILLNLIFLVNAKSQKIGYIKCEYGLHINQTSIIDEYGFFNNVTYSKPNYNFGLLLGHDFSKKLFVESGCIFSLNSINIKLKNLITYFIKENIYCNYSTINIPLIIGYKYYNFNSLMIGLEYTNINNINKNYNNNIIGYERYFSKFENKSFDLDYNISYNSKNIDIKENYFSLILKNDFNFKILKSLDFIITPYIRYSINGKLNNVWKTTFEVKNKINTNKFASESKLYTITKGDNWGINLGLKMKL